MITSGLAPDPHLVKMRCACGLFFLAGPNDWRCSSCEEDARPRHQAAPHRLPQYEYNRRYAMLHDRSSSYLRKHKRRKEIP